MPCCKNKSCDKAASSAKEVKNPEPKKSCCCNKNADKCECSKKSDKK